MQFAAPQTLRLGQPLGIGALRPQDELDPMEVALPTDPSPAMEDNAMVTEMGDGSAVVDLTPDTHLDLASIPFDGNLATVMKETELAAISEQLLRGIESDIASRSEWEGSYTKGIELLGLRMDEASGQINSMGSISKIYHPLLLEAVIRYQSTTMAELLPAEGPVKGKDAAPLSTPDREKLVEAFEADFNHYLTAVAKEYYPDFDRMLFLQGFSGCVFRKVYRCPLRRRPVSEFISGLDFIISNNAISLTDCGRKTHRIKMSPPTLRRMQLTKTYRDVDLIMPTEAPTDAEKKIAATEGRAPTPTLPEDHRHTIYECYTDLDLDDFPHEDESGEPTGLPLPYRVTLDKDSRQVMEIRRNWKETDTEYKERARFVKYGLIPGLGFYDYGYVHLLGNTDRALTAIENQLIDAGQFANFPGFLIAKMGARQETNQMRVPPGAGHEIDTGGMKIQDVAMPLPYKEPSSVLAALSEAISKDAQRLGGIADIQVGEGRQDAPVGTTLALLEQATKIQSAIHKRNHTSQQHEFQIMQELFAEDPSALWRFAQTPRRKWEIAAEFSDINIVPASDPNIHSHMQRVMRAMGLQQMAAQSPQLYDRRKVDAECMTILGYEDPTYFFAPPPPAPDPRIAELGMAYVKAETDKSAAQAMSTHAEAALKQQDLAMEPAVESVKAAQKDYELNIKAFTAGMDAHHEGLAAAASLKEPNGYATGGVVRGYAEGGATMAPAPMPMPQAPQESLLERTLSRLADAISIMAGPRKKTITNAPRAADGKLDFSNLQMVDEPFTPDEIYSE